MVRNPVIVARKLIRFAALSRDNGWQEIFENALDTRGVNSKKGSFGRKTKFFQESEVFAGNRRNFPGDTK